MIDEDLQSRQMAVYGRESMLKLSHAKVLISGIDGLGAEIAKNVALANVKKIVLHDRHKVTHKDLNAHFYLGIDDLDKNRAHACLPKMQELNPTVDVSALTGPLPIHELPSFDVVVGVGLSLDEALAADAACRAAPTPTAFIRADVRGLCGAVFVDLGPSFVCHDATGEAIKSAIVERIDVLKDGRAVGGELLLAVQCVDDEPIELDDGDHVRFSEVVGLDGLNEVPHLEVSDVSKGKKRFVVTLPDEHAASISGAYVRGGLVTEVRMPKQLTYRPLADFLTNPGALTEADESKMAPAATSFSEPYLEVMGTDAAAIRFGRSGLLHLGFRALDRFAAERGGALPAPGSSADAAAVLELCARLNAEAPAELSVAELDAPARRDALLAMAAGASAVLPPMAAIFGGIVGQEVVKAATGKFHPIHQGFYLDALECAPAAGALPPAEVSAEALVSAGRYAHQAAVFGAGFVAQLQRLRVFLVGSGALGCEFLKGFALMGVACGDAGALTVTDDDVIEKSNLSRQFLFRNHNVGQSKSLSAVNAARRMNPQLRATALQDRVAPTTEHVFDDAFWGSLDVVVNALDNVKARLYVDNRCVFYAKPLLESGTLGTKCNTQMVLPHMTENYGASRDPPEKEAPQCAVHNFPHNIDQCLVLAHSEFVGNFDAIPRDACDFAAKGAGWVAELRAAGESESTILEKLRGDPRVTCGMSAGCTDVLAAERATAWDECVGWARRKFESYFCSRIRQLLHNFPHDSVTSQGVPFWSPPKRKPSPLAFDAADPLHMKFVTAAANLRAAMMGVERPPDSRDAAAVAALLTSGSAACAVPRFEPTDDATIETDSKEEDERRRAKAAAGRAVDDAQLIEETVSALERARTALPAGWLPRATEFEKDDDTNFHMDFISSFGNLRARNYAIDEIEQFQAKLKAGRIIPAIATTTALATGFVCLELYKLVANLALEARRNLFCNLALPGPLVALSEPMPCAKIRSGTRWDPDMYMDVDEVAYPDGHTLWDKLLVPAAKGMSLGALLEHFRKEHSLEVQELMLSAGEASRSVYSATIPGMKEESAANAVRDLAELIAEVTGKPPATYFELRDVIFATVGGDDVRTPTVLLHFG